MKTRAAVLRKAGTPWEITELELDRPRRTRCSSRWRRRVCATPTSTSGSRAYPNPWKQEQALNFGATHAFGDPAKAKEVLIDLTRGQLADKVICTVGEMDNDVVKAAVDMTGKAGTIVITGVGYYDMVLPGGILIGYHRRLQGSLFGGATRSTTSR